MKKVLVVLLLIALGKVYAQEIQSKSLPLSSYSDDDDDDEDYDDDDDDDDDEDYDDDDDCPSLPIGDKSLPVLVLGGVVLGYVSIRKSFLK